MSPMTEGVSASARATGEAPESWPGASALAPWAWWPGGLRAVFWIAVAVRFLVFPFAENKQADAPIRSLIAERMSRDPAAARDPRNFCQFGPLPIELIRGFVILDGDARRSSRLLSLLAGILAFVPFFSLGRRLSLDRRLLRGGAGPPEVDRPNRPRSMPDAREQALALSGLALGLSPLHIQVSTTAASEALFLLLFLAALDRLHAAVTEGRRRDYCQAGLWASLAGVTRYDTWLAVPLACVAVVVLVPRRDRRTVLDVASFAGAAALLPVAYLTWSWLASGDPFFFARYITRDHATIAQVVTERLGPALARLRQLGIWVVSFGAAMTPLPLLALAAVARRWSRFTPGTRVVLVAALGPPAIYMLKGLILGDFEPLPRFAIAPGAVLLPLAAAELVDIAARRRLSALLTRAVADGAVLISAIASLLAFAGPGRIWTGAESIAPLTRLDGEDRALARYLTVHRAYNESVFIDTFAYVDIAIVHAARIPEPLSATLAHTRQLDPTLAASRARTGASWFAIHDDSWGASPPPDWPASTERFGHWQLAHVTGPVLLPAGATHAP